MNSILLRSARHGLQRVQQRTRIPSAFYSSYEPARPPKTRIRSGIIGFLSGLTATGLASYYVLLDDYTTSQHVLLKTVQDVSSSASKIKAHTQRIESLEADIADFKKAVPTIEELEKVKRGLVKDLDEMMTHYLEVKTELREMEKDMEKLKLAKLE